MKSTPSRELLVKVYETFANAAIKEYNKTGDLDAAVIFFRLEDAETIAESQSMPDQLVKFFFSGGATKTLLGRLTREVLNADDELKATITQKGGPLENWTLWPDLILHVSEAWMVSTKDKPFDPEMGPVFEHPDREECIVLVLNTREGSYIGCCPIKDMKATYQPLNFLRAEGKITVEDVAPTKH